MENSIEEDIEIIESIIEEYENCSVPEIDMQVNVIFREKQNNALKHILSDYKRVLKENEEWQRAYQEEKDKQFDLIKENEELKEGIIPSYEETISELEKQLFESIPVQKIKDKIEVLKSKVDYYEEQAQEPFSFNFWHREFLKATHKKQALQELLEKEQ